MKVMIINLRIMTLAISISHMAWKSTADKNLMGTNYFPLKPIFWFDPIHPRQISPKKVAEGDSYKEKGYSEHLRILRIEVRAS